MLHPALTRVLSVVLAIVCVILLFSAAFGFSEAEQLWQENEKQRNKLVERIDNYQRLTALLADQSPYRDADAELTEREQKHSKDASQHRTDLATHTAEEGGYQAGAEALWTAKAELAEKKAEYEQTVKAVAVQEKALAEKKSEVGNLAALAAACAQMAVLPAPADPGGPPAMPVSPIIPENPGDFSKPAPSETDYESQEAYQSALQSYQAEAATHAAKQAAYEKALSDSESYEVRMAEYTLLLAEYQSKAAPYQAYTALQQQASAALGALGVSTDGSMAAIAAALQAAYTQASGMIAAGEAALAEGKAQLSKAGEALHAAEGKIQGNLENIWWHMGNLEDEAEALEESRDALIQQSAQLTAEREVLEQQKENENKLRSTRILLMQNKEVEEMVNAGGDLAESAAVYAESFRLSYENQHFVRRLCCLLAAIAAISGLFTLPAAFEKWKGRVLLLLPALIALVASGAAVCLRHSHGLESFYAAMPVVFFALCYLLAAFPKKKQPH